MSLSKHRIAKYILRGILIVWVCYVGLQVVNWHPRPMGESDDYMFTTISLEYQGNLGIDLEDVEHAKQDFPEFADYLQENYDLGLLSTVVDPKTGRLPWYFGTYSAICIPVKKALEFMGKPQCYTYSIVNYLLYLVVIVATVLFYKSDSIDQQILELILAMNPVVFYLVWQSSEVFLYAMACLTLLAWHRKWYKTAGVLISIASTMNSTIMILGIAIIVDYLVAWIRWDNFIKDWKKNITSLVLFGCSFIPSLVPFIYYKAKYGVWNLQVNNGYAAGGIDYWKRFASYLFDWNYGIFPYMPVLLLLFFTLSVLCMVHRKYLNILYLLAFLGVIATYSIMWHINSGMSGIARYSVWACPIMIYGVSHMQGELADQWSAVKSNVVRVLLVIGCIYTFKVIMRYGVMFAEYTSDIKVTPVAQVIIEKYPHLYIEMESSFIDRVHHIPGGYEYTGPVIYNNDEYLVTKVLLRSGDEEQVIDSLEVPDESYDEFYSQLYKDKPFYYLTFSPKMNIRYKVVD